MTTMHTEGPWYVDSGTYEGRNIYSVAFVTDDEGFTYQLSSPLLKMTASSAGTQTHD